MDTNYAKSDKNKNGIFLAFSQVTPLSENTMVLDSIPKAVGNSTYIKNYIRNRDNNDLVVFHFNTNQDGGYSIPSPKSQRKKIVFGHLKDSLINRNCENPDEPFININSSNQNNDNKINEDLLNKLTIEKIKKLAAKSCNKWGSNQ